MSNEAANSPKTAWGKPFPPGKSGNPTGRPRIDPEVLVALKAASLPAAKRLAALALESDDEDVALKACLAILDRTGYKPTDKLELSADPDAPPNPFPALSLEELKAIARAQLEKDSK
jgi:hypothetical protein